MVTGKGIWPSTSWVLVMGLIRIRKVPYLRGQILRRKVGMERFSNSIAQFPRKSRIKITRRTTLSYSPTLLVPDQTIQKFCPIARLNMVLRISKVSRQIQSEEMVRMLVVLLDTFSVKEKESKKIVEPHRMRFTLP